MYPWPLSPCSLDEVLTESRVETYSTPTAGNVLQASARTLSAFCILHSQTPTAPFQRSAVTATEFLFYLYVSIDADTEKDTKKTT